MKFQCTDLNSIIQIIICLRTIMYFRVSFFLNLIREKICTLKLLLDAKKNHLQYAIPDTLHMKLQFFSDQTVLHENSITQ